MTDIANFPLKVLLVEDDNDDRYFFKEALDKLDTLHELSFAKDCFELFSLLEENKVFDVIFLDINLPVMSGKDCLKQIKLSQKYKDVPVIIFTGSSAKHDIDFVYENGAHYHIIKPYAHINYVASLKIVLSINWKEQQQRPSPENFVINLAFTN